MFELFSRSIDNICTLTKDEKTLLVSKLQSRSILRDEFLLRENETCQSLFFLNKGTFRQYSISESGREKTKNLFVEGDWVFDHRSFITQQPTNTLIQALENSELFELFVYDMHDLIKASGSFFQLGSILQQTTSFYDNVEPLTPFEKYMWLLQNKPTILQKFPLKYVASYLETTPETLSRVRKKISISN